MSSERGKTGSCGIKAIHNRPRALGFPLDTPPNQAWVYGLGFPFQISPTEAGIFANIGRKDLLSQKKGDFEAGTDLIIFNDLDRIHADRAIPLLRGKETDHPRTGERLLMSSYPVAGGFVPLGAKHEDGSSHPYAGTGFGLATEVAYPRDRPGGPEQLSEKVIRWNFQQYSYDGRTFRIISTRQVDADQIIPGKLLGGNPLTCAIPDGDDLLMAMMTRPEGDTSMDHTQTGVARWRWDTEKGWKVCEYMPILAAVNMSEASLIRDLDGSLLVTARPRVSSTDDIFVWQSRDKGATWQEVIHVESVRQAPITINRSLDGTPYIAANPLNTLAGQKREYVREALHLWPLAPDRRSLLDPMLIRDGLLEWGRTRDGRIRALDHPSGCTVRLADGNWRHLLAYRVLGPWEIQVGTDLASTPIPGLYVDEVLSRGEPMPEWQF